MKKINTFLLIIINITNIFLINFKVFYIKKILIKKIIFFYHPKSSLNKIHNFYIKYLFNNIDNNFEVLNGYNLDFLNKESVKNFFIIKQGLLKWIFGIDIFISTNVCDVFTNNSIRIYMHHTCYDTPLVSQEKEKMFLKRIIKYDYFFLSSKVTENFFIHLFKYNNKIKKPRIYHVGYPKFDYLLKNKNKYKRKKIIIIAPTLFNSFPNLSLKNKLEQIIQNLLKNKGYHIVLRPHPTDIHSSKVKSIYHNFQTSFFLN
tara:strand:+ start:62 stop:838 length:777 start_codon:yes stop_codon:yes gene_type:complete